MSLIPLIIDRIQYSETQTGAYVLFLKEAVGNKKLPIVIGGIEAHSITIGLEKDIIPQRPLTHDLMKTLMENYGILLKRVIINKFDQGIFYAMLITEKDGVEKAIDSRTSDAVAMAVRFEVPIFCEQTVMDEAGIVLPGTVQKVDLKLSEDDDEVDLEDLLNEIEQISAKIVDSDNENLPEIEKLSRELFGKRVSLYSKNEIQKMLDEAIEDEQYERAAKLKRLMELLRK